MGQNFQELDPNSFLPHPISYILREVDLIDDFSKKSNVLESYANAMEREMMKMLFFERELPLSMSLVKDAIEFLRKKSLEWRAKIVPVLEEFLPVKADLEVNKGGANESIDKRNWLSSVQLWSTPRQYEKTTPEPVFHLGSALNKYEVGEGSGSNKSHYDFKSTGGAFMPFKKKCATIKEKKFPVVEGCLSLSIPGGHKVVEKDSSDMSTQKENCEFTVSPKHDQQQNKSGKKPRRCWSLELHNHFVEALNELGGAQSTPKLIRDVMKIDGLTNDEVKSHLQKFRLHLNKVIKSKDKPWLNKNQSAGFSEPITSQSDSPLGPLHNGESARGGSTDEGSKDDESSESPSWKKARFEKRT